MSATPASYMSSETSPCAIIKQYFNNIPQRPVIGLLINSVWYRRPRDEYWVFRSCHCEQASSMLTLHFDYDHHITGTYNTIRIDDDGFLTTAFTCGTVKNCSHSLSLRDSSLRFVYQRHNIQ